MQIFVCEIQKLPMEILIYIRRGMPRDVKYHKTYYVHGKSHGHRYSMLWACWLYAQRSP